MAWTHKTRIVLIPGRMGLYSVVMLRVQLKLVSWLFLLFIYALTCWLLTHWKHRQRNCTEGHCAQCLSQPPGQTAKRRTGWTVLMLLPYRNRREQREQNLRSMLKLSHTGRDWSQSVLFGDGVLLVFRVLVGTPPHLPPFLTLNLDHRA